MSRNKSTDRDRRTMAVVHPNAAAIDVGATMHMAAVVPDLPFAEYTVSESPLRKELVNSTVTLKDGMASIPQGPGLGVELNEETVAKLRVS